MKVQGVGAGGLQGPWGQSDGIHGQPHPIHLLPGEDTTPTSGCWEPAKECVLLGIRSRFAEREGEEV